ncbi:hypothetical protein HDU81_008317 [Chytriomyces hyalinus]|nr:hypothetical protein HDU81_008317 [Chytriomyces hyalinus]
MQFQSMLSPILSFSAKKDSVMNIANLIHMDSTTTSCDTHISDTCHSDMPHLAASSCASTPVFYYRDSLTPPTTPSSCNYASSCYTPGLPSEDAASWVQLPPLSKVSPVAAACRKAPYSVPQPRKCEPVSDDVSVDNELLVLPFQCPHCPNRYKTKHYLESHSATHMTARPFVCTLSDGACRGSFRRLSDLRRHMKTVKH